MITYNDIYEAARSERYSEHLQKLPKSFVKDVVEYLRDKKEIASKDDDDFSDVIMKTKKQLENATTLFKELISRRRKKVLNLVFIASETGISKKDFDNMLNFEKELFESLMNCIEVSGKILNENFNGKVEEFQNDLVVFLEDVEEFMGFDGTKMGRFEKGQVANIPKDIAKILIDDKKCEIVEK